MVEFFRGLGLLFKNEKVKDAEDTRVNILRECSLCHQSFSAKNIPAISVGEIIADIEAQFKNHNFFKHGGQAILIRNK